MHKEVKPAAKAILDRTVSYRTTLYLDPIVFIIKKSFVLCDCCLSAFRVTVVGVI